LGSELTILVLSYNNIRHVDACMDSFLSAQYGVDFRVVVVDNASTDGSLEHLLARYASNPRVKVLGLDRNHGFGGGIMKALELLGFPSGYLAFSNADLRVDPGWFPPIMDAFRLGDVAAVGPVVCYYHKPGVIQGAGKILRSRWVPTMNADYAKNEDYYTFLRAHTGPFPVLYPDGALVVFDSEAFKAIGGFDTSFFLYREQMDLGLRIWLSGRRALTAPASRAYHVGGASSVGRYTRSLTHRNYYLSHKNNIRAILKDLPISVLPPVLGLVSLRLLVYSMLKSVAVRDPLILLATVRAAAWNIANIGDTMAERAKFRRAACRGYWVLEQLIKAEFDVVASKSGR
jgi:GT2 family glycosyltransferase